MQVRSLKVRLLLQTLVIAAAAALFLLVLLALLQYRALDEERRTAAAQVSHLLRAALENAMLKRDVPGLAAIVSRLGDVAGIERVLVLAPDGEVRFASDSAWLGKHLRPDSELPAGEVVMSRRDDDTLRSWLAVPNQPPCQECHGPIATHPINGILVVDHDIRSLPQRVRVLTAVAIALGALVLMLTMALQWRAWDRLVLQRLAQIMHAVRAWSEQRFEVVLAPTGKDDELSRLAEQLQHMADRWHQAMQEQARTQAFIQNIIDAMPEGVRVIRKRDHEVLFCNAQYRKLLGLSENDPATPCYRAYGRSEPCPETLLACPLHEPEQQRFLHVITRADGSTLALQIDTAAFAWSSDTPAEEPLIVEVATPCDAAVAISQEQRLAELGMLAAGIAHEIHNPLASIRLGVQGALLDLDAAPEDLRSRLERQLRVVDGKIDECLAVTSRLLLLARRSDHSVGPVLLQNAVQDTLQLLAFEAEQRGIEQRSEMPVAPVYLQANDTELRQILFNLVQNAHHAMPNGGVLTVRVRTEESWVFIEVEDTGQGIDAETLPHIFKPFFSKRADGVPGTGLGLTIVRTLVEQYGGTITVDSHPGQGTRFVLAFPLPQK